MSPHTGGFGLRVSAEDRREQLIDATIAVMRRQGVQSVTLRVIAAEAKASLAAVHYCFADKDALLHAAVERWLRNMITGSLSIPSGEGLKASLMRIAEYYWQTLENTPDDILAELELVLWAARGRSEGSVTLEIYPRYIHELSEVFERELKTTGEICSWKTEQLAQALLVIIDGCSLQFLSRPNLAEHRALYSKLLDALTRSLGS